MNHELGFVRNDGNGCTISLLHVTTRTTCSGHDALNLLRSAITDWVKFNPVGKQAWEGSRRDFNIADLGEYEDDETLQVYLREQGIMQVSVEFIHNESTDMQDYDLVLPEAP